MSIRIHALAAAPLAVFGLAAGLMGCEVIAGLNVDNKLDPDAGAGGSGGTPVTCEPAHAPQKPSGATPGGTIEFMTALHTLNLGEGLDGAGIGFDLDDRCTCAPSGPSCAEPTWATADHCDGDGGRDNAIGKTFAAINKLAPGTISSQLINSYINDGSWTLMGRVRGYNGEPDDDQVELALYPALSLPAAPLWDGSDTWPIMMESLGGAQMGPDDAIFVDPNAYVSGGVLVATFPKLTIVLLGQVRLELRLSKVVTASTITQDAMGYHLTNGALGGQWLLADMFYGLSSLRYGGDNEICVGSGIYYQVRDAFCSFIDLNASGDETGACDAFSFGMGYTADPAALGPVMPLPAPPGGCAMGKDPKDDMCNMF